MAKTYKSLDLALKDYGTALNMLGEHELPLAAKGTLNRLAFESRTQIAKKELGKKFTLRNNFEERSIQYQGVRRGVDDINRMQSTAGQVDVMKFQRGPKHMRDMRQQELGETVGARKGSKVRRVPTKEARIGKAANRVVAKRFRPSSGGDWLNLREIESRIGLNSTGMERSKRVARAHRMMQKYRYSFPDNQLYMLPYMYRRRHWGVFRTVGGESVKVHALTRKKAKLKKRPVVKPGYEQVVRTQADKIWEEEVDRRLVRKVNKLLG